jgi:exosome complex RNA-binding protein Rrp4
MKNHMMEFFAEPSIGVIIGVNGYVWIEAIRKGASAEDRVTEQERFQIAVLRNTLVLLDQAKIPIFKDTILKVIEEQQINNMHPRDMLANAEVLLVGAQELIKSEIS